MGRGARNGAPDSPLPAPESELIAPDSELWAPSSKLPAPNSVPMVTSGVEKSEIRNSNFEISRMLPAPSSLLPAILLIWLQAPCSLLSY
jgi:hypothetical protein